MSDIDRQSLMEVFIFDTGQMLEQLEQLVIGAENGYTQDQINEIFRIMHTIKGSSAMMLFDNIAMAAHVIEDLFFYLRDKHPKIIDNSVITDHVLESMDFLKNELSKIQQGGKSDGDATEVHKKISEFLIELKFINGDGPALSEGTDPKETKVIAETPANNEEPVSNKDLKTYDAIITFTEGSEMENVRAYTLVYNLKNIVVDLKHTPSDLIDEASIQVIRDNGFKLEIVSDKDYDSIFSVLSNTIYAKDIILEERKTAATQPASQEPSPEMFLEAELELEPEVVSTPTVDTKSKLAPLPKDNADHQNDSQQPGSKKMPVQSMISVGVNKLDQLLKLIGELVIAEAMVTENPDLEGLELESFTKEKRQLRKIIQELQQTIMSTRMLTLSTTFFKMNRIVRDMCKQLNKEVNLEILGEDTEVDKNIIEHISDPIMHIIRNAVDHGIESPEERKKNGKPERGTVILEAKNIGSDVLILVKDDGKGLDKDKILSKAQRNGLLKKLPEEYSDKEIYQFIFLPGFSTNESVTSYSGRGVGMDVVSKNLEVISGTTTVDSIPGEGSTFTMKIPLTLAIIKGMIIKMGGEKYTVPISNISNSFKPSRKDMFVDPNGNEMITVYGEHLNIVKLYEFFEIHEAARDIEEGIMMIIENGDDRICLFIDDLLGEQSVVVKNLPKYIKRIPGLGGCTLLGNGDISLIIEPAAFFDK